MAGLGDMNIKIGADLSELLTKVEAAKAKLNQLTESEQQLKASINDLNSSLKQNEAELGKTATSLRKLVDSGKGATVEANKLRKEIAGLATNSADLTTKLGATKVQLAATTTQIKSQSVALKEAETASGGFGKGATKLYSGLRTLANLIPGIGIGGLVGLIAGPLVDAFQDWFDSISKVSAATQILQANQANLNDVIKEANKDAGKQTADLKILYDAATNVNLSMKDRLAAVKGLQKEFPDFFANLKTEAILNGSSKAAYDAATLSIIANARAKAALSKIEELSAQQLDNAFQKQKIINATNAEAQRTAQKNTEIAIATDEFGNAVAVKTVAEQLKTIEARKKAALEAVDINNKSLAAQIDFLTKFASLPSLAKVIEDGLGKDKIHKEKIAKAAKETAIVYTETLQHAIEEILKKGFQRPIDPFKGLLGGKVSVDLSAVKANLDAIKANEAAIAILQQKLQDTADITNKVLAPAFEALFTSIAEGGTNAFQAFGEALNQVIKKLVVAVLKAIALGAITALITGKAFNIGNIVAGALKGFAEGGEVKGPGSGKSDSILARVSKGEYIIPADKVKKYGVPFFDKIRNGQQPPSFFNGLPKFALGGFVSPSLMGNIGGGQSIQVFGRIEAQGDKLVTIFDRANRRISRNG